MRTLSLSLVFAAVATLSLSTAAADPVGTWVADAAGQQLVLKLEAGGRGSLNGDAGFWSLRGSSLTLSSPDGESVVASYSKNSITLTIDGTRLAFSRKGGSRAAAATGAMATGRPFVPKKKVKAKRVSMRGETKASVAIPIGWKSGWSKDGDSFLLAPAGKLKGKAAVSISYDLLTPAQKQQRIGALLGAAAEDLVGDARADLVVGPEEFTVNKNRAGRLIGRGVVNGQKAEGYVGGIIIGDFGLLIIGLYPEAHSETMRASLDTILASIKATAPKMNRKAMQLIQGCWVDSNFESDSRTGSSSTVEQIKFFANGTYEKKSTMSVSVPGGGGYNDSSRDAGTYAIFGGTLVMTTKKGERKTYEVSDSGGRLQMGGVKFRRC